jgi:oxygen-dependent protoporphyrinogen oxidase
MTVPKYAVIGGGVSGMAAAHYLLQQGSSVDIYEASDRLGGRMAVDTLLGEEVCFGGKNIGYAYTEFRAFLESYGTPDYEYFGINSARLIRGAPQKFNSQNKIKSALTLWRSGKLSDLIKLKRLMKQVSANRSYGDTGGLTLGDEKTPTVADLFSQKFSQTIIRALTVRMNGAEPADIAPENFGTHLQMLNDEYEQLKKSISDIFQRFERIKKLSVKFHQTVETISANKRRFTLKALRGEYSYDGVIIAAPAYAAAKLLKPTFPEISQALSPVRYFPVAVIIAEYEQDVFTPDIRALTFGADSPLSNIGAYGLTCLNRVRYTLSGKRAAEFLSEGPDDAYLLTAAEAKARPYFNLDNNPCRAFKLRNWEKGLCGYTQDEAHFHAQLEAALLPVQGLELAGDYMSGASIENCFQSAKAAVARLLSPNAAISRIAENTAQKKEAAHV